jgi:hypothetical protein
MPGDSDTAATLRTLRDAANDAVQRAFAEGSSTRETVAKEATVAGV